MRKIVDYNQKVNLTAITSPEGIEDRHFADSLLFAAQPEETGKLVDVGTGAGFPGVVAKIFVKPDLQLTPTAAHRQAGGLFEVPVRGNWRLGKSLPRSAQRKPPAKSGVTV